MRLSPSIVRFVDRKLLNSYLLENKILINSSIDMEHLTNLREHFESFYPILRKILLILDSRKNIQFIRNVVPAASGVTRQDVAPFYDTFRKVRINNIYIYLFNKERSIFVGDLFAEGGVPSPKSYISVLVGLFLVQRLRPDVVYPLSGPPIFDVRDHVKRYVAFYELSLERERDLLRPMLPHVESPEAFVKNYFSDANVIINHAFTVANRIIEEHNLFNFFDI